MAEVKKQSLNPHNPAGVLAAENYIQENELKTVTMNFHTKCHLRLQSGTVIEFKPGPQEVPADLVNHPWVKAHAQMYEKLGTAEKSAVAPAAVQTEDTSDAAEGEENEEESGEEETGDGEDTDEENPTREVVRGRNKGRKKK